MTRNLLLLLVLGFVAATAIAAPAQEEEANNLKPLESDGTRDQQPKEANLKPLETDGEDQQPEDPEESEEPEPQENESDNRNQDLEILPEDGPDDDGSQTDVAEQGNDTEQDASPAARRRRRCKHVCHKRRKRHCRGWLFGRKCYYRYYNYCHRVCWHRCRYRKCYCIRRGRRCRRFLFIKRCKSYCRKRRCVWRYKWCYTHHHG